jgi:hypothetical protein
MPLHARPADMRSKERTKNSIHIFIIIVVIYFIDNNNGKNKQVISHFRVGFDV